MKLNLNKVAVLLGALGFVSYPAFAGNTHYHRTHHAKMKHHMACHDYKGDYKAVLPDPCQLDMFQLTLEAMNQNLGRARPTIDCNKPISLSGGINFDAHTGNLSQGYAGENNERLSLNDAYLNIHGNVNDWTKAFVSLSYNNVSTFSTAFTNGSTNGYRQFILSGSQYSNVYPVNTLTVQEGYIRFANFDVYPIFVEVGKEFTNYGRYQIHPITRSITQVLTESLRTQAELGFITRMGLNGSIYAFDTPSAKVSQTHSGYTYGAALSFDQPSEQLGYDLGIAYLSNMLGVNDVVGAVNGNRLLTGAALNRYVSNVSSMALYGDVNTGPFAFGLRYTTALQNFSPLDLPTNIPATTGAKPWGFDLKAAYGFEYWGKGQDVYLGYQVSGNAVRIALPKSRWQLGYDVVMWRYTTLGLQYNHDIAYSQGSGGTGNSSNTLALRAAVEFG